MRIVSLNLRFAHNPEMNNQAIREPRIVDFVKSFRPTVMGVQECEKFWRERLLTTIGKFGYLPAQPERIGEDGKFAFKNFIWYDSENAELLESGALWLSETPDTPSKGFGSRFYISCGYAVIKSKSTNECLAYINTHLDVHNAETRQKEIGVVKAKIQELKSKGYPVFVTGDFNDVEDSDVYLAMTDGMFDARKTAKKSTELNTFNSYTSEEETLSSENYKRIDYCFYCGENISIDEFAVVDKWTDGYMSDHNAVVIDANL